MWTATSLHHDSPHCPCVSSPMFTTWEEIAKSADLAFSSLAVGPSEDIMHAQYEFSGMKYDVNTLQST